jgi:hypothetical protein
MKVIIMILSVLCTTHSFAQSNNEHGRHRNTQNRTRVYCAPYNGSYSIYRTIDRQDIGVSKIKKEDCEIAAQVANENRSRLVCSTYNKGNAKGYSLYKIKTGKDLGKRTFSNLDDCNIALITAANTRTGIVCSPYRTGSGYQGYSVFKIRNNKDIGQTVFDSLNNCNQAVATSTRSMFCGRYTNDAGKIGYSPYSIETGEDLGSTLFNSLQACADTL